MRFTAPLALLLLTSFAVGDSIAVNNPSFETVQVSSSDSTLFTLGSGDFSATFGSTEVINFNGTPYATAFVPGWTTTAAVSEDVGVFNPTSLGGLSGQDGTNTAYANGEIGQPNTFSQSLSAVLQPGVYILSVEVGKRLSVDAGSPIISLDGAGTPTSSVTPALIDGGFVTFAETYVIGVSDPNLNDPLGITLGEGIATGFDQINFDNVSLQFTPSTAAPVPSPLWGGVALLGIVAGLKIPAQASRSFRGDV